MSEMSVLQQRAAAFALLREIVGEADEGFMVSLDTLTRARELLAGHAPTRTFRLVPLGDGDTQRVRSHPDLEVTDLSRVVAIKLLRDLPVGLFQTEAQRWEQTCGNNRHVLIVDNTVEFLRLEEIPDTHDTAASLQATSGGCASCEERERDATAY